MEKVKTKVYIASPYTKGDVAVNVKAQLDAYDILMCAGYAPYAPLLTHFNHMAHPHPAEEWYEMDNEWIPSCDIMLRLPGDSTGADREVSLAIRNDMKVYHGITSLLANAPREWKK